VIWPGGSAPTLTTTAGGVDVLNFVTYDGGLNWFGFLAALNMQLHTGSRFFGYFGGGYGSSAYSRVDRIDYSNDTAIASIKGSLSLARYYLAATGSSSFGYFGGGNGAVSTIDRIDYSNDTATAAVKGPLSLARYLLAATGSSSFGYFGGGAPSPGFSTVDRIDYSHDTLTAAAKGPLSLTRFGVAATQHSAL
jgi:hypothetical protein